MLLIWSSNLLGYYVGRRPYGGPNYYSYTIVVHITDDETNNRIRKDVLGKTEMI